MTISVSVRSFELFLGKNLRLVGCATVCAKSEVMLMPVQLKRISMYGCLFGALF